MIRYVIGYLSVFRPAFDDGGVLVLQFSPLSGLVYFK